MKTIKSGEGSRSFDETTDEELMEIAKTVDVKTRVQLTQEEQIKPREIVKQNDLLEDEELKEINLKGRLEAFKQETEKHAMENKVTEVCCSWFSLLFDIVNAHRTGRHSAKLHVFSELK